MVINLIFSYFLRIIIVLMNMFKKTHRKLYTQTFYCKKYKITYQISLKFSATRFALLHAALEHSILDYLNVKLALKLLKHSAIALHLRLAFGPPGKVVVHDVD